jgi:hypothetical protein
MLRRIALGALALVCFEISSGAADFPELQELRAKIAAQQEQIDRLQQSVNQQQKLIEQALQSARAPATAPAATASTDAPVKLVNAVNRQARDIVNLPRAMQHEETKSSPLSVSIGNTTFAPLGFVDFTFFGRSTNSGSGIGTGFGGIPYNNSPQGHLSETNFSTQNSRIGFRVDSNFMGAKVLGYFEADFLGAAPGNVFQTSNANAFRMRNVFVDAQKGPIEILGGQDWTLFTPNRKGLSPIPGDIFYSQAIDTNYLAGLVWARQSQFRLIAHPNNDLAFGMSLENPQQFIGGAVTLPSALSTSLATLLNNGNTTYTAPNMHPDIIFKGAYDAHAGDKLLHVEAGALIRTFKIATSGGVPVTYTSHSATAASGEVNANLEVAKNVRLIANTFFGSGGGRYTGGLGPDLVVRANGDISPVHSYATSAGFEANISRNTVLYSYYSGAYFKKNVALDANGTTIVGYGASNSLSANRSIQEATFGIVQTFWKNPNYGALSLITQYSYLWRNPWSAPPIGPKVAKTNMYYVDLRYTLP